MREWLDRYQRHSTDLRPGGQVRRGPNGRRLCRWCELEVPVGRQTFCSRPCVDEYLIRARSGSARRAVRVRDRGVCALCRLDTGPAQAGLRRLEAECESDGRHVRRPWSWDPAPAPACACPACELARRLGFGSSGPAWEMDHVVPVVEGGGSCGLENLRTLCIRCHRTVTAELAARLARKRRLEAGQAQPLPLFAEAGR